MVTCRSCGSAIGEDARFCPVCGASVALGCPNCGSAVSTDARFCATCGYPLAEGSPLLEERKLVTVLFADVTGSTSLGERLDPERLREVLATYFSAMSAVIESWGGTVEKYIGDAVMAVFGVPAVREDDAERALAAALEMLRRADDLNDDFRSRHGIEIRLRIGVNTGEVVAPRGGGPGAQMLVIGDAVNVAARLEQSAEAGSILAGPATFLAARHAFGFGPEVPLELKGKQQRVGARTVVQVLPAAERERGIPGVRSSMVGRAREFETLVDLLHDAIATREPRVAAVFGPAGIGKSRLIQEFLRMAESRHAELTVLRGRCLAAGPAVTFWALGEILRDACAITLDDPVAAAREKLGRVRELLADQGLRHEDTELTVFALAATAGISLEGNPLDAYAPDAVDEELGRAWPRFASALATHGPMVLVVEDLHWASDRLLEMLRRLIARSAGPVFVVATARPEFLTTHPDFATGSEGMTSVNLRPLTEEQSAQMLGGLLLDTSLPTTLRAQVLGKAEGNPFFLEEIVRRLIDEGALVRDGERWLVTDVAAQVVLPETVQGLLAARIDRLPEEEKRVLQEAAVVGRVFWAEPVARALGNGSVLQHLAELERRGLVLARPVSSFAGQIEYAFRHALVREVAYGGLPKARRARAHAGHAAWIEERAGDRVDEFADLVAHHYGAAVVGEDADLAWAGDEAAFRAIRGRAHASAMRAGTLARKRSALDRAAELHELAVELAEDDIARAHALEELAIDHDDAYHGDSAFPAYLRALEVVRAGAGAPADVARLCVAASRLAVKVGPFQSPPDPATVESLIDEGLASDPDVRTRAWLLQLRGDIAPMYKDLDRDDPVPLAERIRSAELALELAEATGDADLLAWVVRGLSNLYELAGDVPRSFRVIERIADFVDDIPSPTTRAESLLMLSLSLSAESRFEASVEPARAAYELAEGASAHARMHGTYSRMYGAFHLGRWGEVVELADEHARLYPEEAGVPCGAVNGGIVLAALAFAEMGRTERARELLDMIPPSMQEPHPGLFARAESALGDIDVAERRARAGAVGDVADLWGIEARHALIDVRLVHRRWDDLRSAVDAARPLAEAVPIVGAACDRAEGAVLLASGEPDGGIARLMRALDSYRRLGVPFEVARTQELLAEAGVDDAGRLREEALATYEALGARPHADRVRAAARTPPERE